eukprot:gene13885-biopygen3994
MRFLDDRYRCLVGASPGAVRAALLLALRRGVSAQRVGVDHPPALHPRAALRAEVGLALGDGAAVVRHATRKARGHVAPGAVLSSACLGDTPSDASMGEGGKQLELRQGDPVGIP